MRLLLDSNALLWALMAPGKLRASTAEAISSEANRVWASVVSPWELSIKASHGKIRAPEDLASRLEEMRIPLLQISLAHTHVIASLPHHHRDPFDRMLIAQAQVEGMTLVTSDREIHRYQVSVMPAI